MWHKKAIFLNEIEQANKAICLKRVKKAGKDMADETVEALAKQLVRRMGRSQAMQICQTNKWFRVLDHIKSAESKSMTAK